MNLDSKNTSRPRASGSKPSAAFWRDPALPYVESRRACNSRACYKPHSHPTYSIGAVDAGSSLFTGTAGSGAGTAAPAVRIAAGSLVLVPAGSLHACNPLPDAAWSYQMLHLDMQWLGAQRLAPMPERVVVLDAPALYARFCDMNSLLFSDADRQQKTAALLAFLAACDGAEGKAIAAPAPAPLPGKLTAVLHAIEQEPLASLEQLARQAGLSRYQLIRAFRAATGMTPHAYQLNLCVNRARAGLLAGEELADMACRLGFADQSHLQRVFKEHAGVTPGLYRA